MLIPGRDPMPYSWSSVENKGDRVRKNCVGHLYSCSTLDPDDKLLNVSTWDHKQVEFFMGIFTTTILLQYLIGTFYLFFDCATVQEALSLQRSDIVNAPLANKSASQ